jgi:hypothetical protein
MASAGAPQGFTDCTVPQPDLVDSKRIAPHLDLASANPVFLSFLVAHSPSARRQISEPRCPLPSASAPRHDRARIPGSTVPTHVKPVAAHGLRQGCRRATMGEVPAGLFLRSRDGAELSDSAPYSGAAQALLYCGQNPPAKSETQPSPQHRSRLLGNIHEANASFSIELPDIRAAETAAESLTMPKWVAIS